MSVTKEIQILYTFLSRLDPAILQKHLGSAVVDHRIAKPGYDAPVQRNRTIGFIQCSVSSAKILNGFSVMPDAVVSAYIPLDLNAQSLGRKFFFIIDQVQP